VGRVVTEQRGRVVIATISNPPHALMDEEIVAGLGELVATAESDDSVGAVVLTGEHESRFIAHYDVGSILAGVQAAPSVGRGTARAALRSVAAIRHVPGADSAIDRTPLAGLAELERFHEIFLRMNRCGAVFIAAINGSTQGGGCELSLACDYRLMAKGDHGIGQPEILLGFPPGGGGTQRLARLLGSSRALKIVLDGGPLSPEQALEIGLIDEVVDGQALLDRALELGKRMAGRSKAAVGAAKRAVYEGGSLPLADGLRLERAEFMATGGTPEAVSAMSAYLEELERTSELPAYADGGLGEVLERGRFGT
jgi:enoyl-CoA hydratase/carnithine racemase